MPHKEGNLIKHMLYVITDETSKCECYFC